MRIWVYGDSPERIRDMIVENISSYDTVTGVSVGAEIGSSFPQSGLIPAISAAIQNNIDLLLVPTFELLGNTAKAEQTIELFRSYNVSVRSVSSNGISSS